MTIERKQFICEPRHGFNYVIDVDSMDRWTLSDVFYTNDGELIELGEEHFLYRVRMQGVVGDKGIDNYITDPMPYDAAKRLCAALNKYFGTPAPLDNITTR